MKLNEQTSNNGFHRTQTPSGACTGRGAVRLSMFALIEIAILTAPVYYSCRVESLDCVCLNFKPGAIADPSFRLHPFAFAPSTLQIPTPWVAM